VAGAAQSGRLEPWRVMVFTAAALAALSVIVFGYLQGATTFRDSETYQQRVLECQDRAFHRLPQTTQDAATVELLERVSEFCYDDQRRTNQLSESNIRRGLYIHQRYENNVILFMVVLITLAGAALAGVQLLTSYNLAATGHLMGDGATDLTLEQGKLSIKSSVTGLIVLALSLGFFGIYIFQVYAVLPSADAKDVPVSRAAAPNAPAPATATATAKAKPAHGKGILLDSGGVDPPGPPPAHVATKTKVGAQ